MIGEWADHVGRKSFFCESLLFHENYVPFLYVLLEHYPTENSNLS